MNDKCAHCASSIGDEAKVQPTTVDNESFCPPCFTTRRVHAEPGRLNATQSAPVRCPYCGWLSVSFGALPGSGLRCGHCLRFGSRLVRIDELPLTKSESTTVEELARVAGQKEPARIKRS